MTAPPDCSRPNPKFVESLRKQEKLKLAGTRGRDLPPSTPADPYGPPPFEWESAMCLMGAGNRAVVSTYGIMRGLHKKGKLNHFDGIVGISGGFWALSAYTFGLADLTADGDAEDLLLDVSRDWKPEAIADLDVLEKESMGFATTLPFGLREICELPFYSCAECLKAVGLPVPGCHAFWQESVYRTYLKTYGIPKGRFLASSEAEAERIVSGRPDLKKSDFLWPRRCGKTQDNPSGEHRKPEPMALYASIMPTGLSNANGLGALSEQQVKAAKGGLADAITAREEYNGVTTVPFFATPTAAGTRYEAVYVDGRMAPQGPPEMRFLKCQANTGCKPPAPIRFNKVHHPPHEALVDPPGCCPPCQRGCCPLEPSSERLIISQSSDLPPCAATAATSRRVDSF